MYRLQCAALLASSGVYAQHKGHSETEEHRHEHQYARRGAAAPIMGGQNFPDPSHIRVSDGWHAFATNMKVKGTSVHVPIAYSPDWNKWTFRGTKDAMPKIASWIDASSPRIWAPDVVQLPDGSFIMYYTAAYKKKSNLHCVSFATSKTVGGPYKDSQSEPWICPTAQGGAIDPSGYQNSDGTHWVVYKVDGNAIGHGGECLNTVKPIVSTPIMLQQVKADGHSKIGNPIQLITNGPADGPVVEAPSLSYLGGKYVLFFSSNCFATTKYDVSYATADHIKGPYTKYGPLFKTGNLGMTAPGGLDIALNGNHAIWHAYVEHGPNGTVNTQNVWTGAPPKECIGRKHNGHDGRRYGADSCARNHNGGRAAFTAILSQKNNVVHASNVS